MLTLASNPRTVAFKLRFASKFEFSIGFPLQPTIRHYLELLYINVFLKDEYFVDIIRKLLSTQENIKIQPLMSVLYVAIYYLLFKKFERQDNYVGVLKLVSLNIGNNTSFSRYLSQYVLTRLVSEGKVDVDDPDVKACVKIMARNRENMVMERLFEEIINKYHNCLEKLSVLTLLETRFFNEKLEIVHGYICDQFKDVSLQSTINMIDDEFIAKPDEAAIQALNEIFGELVPSKEQQMEVESEAIFQRKIDNVLSIFPVLESRGSHSKKAEIVVVASLLDKLPNLANLTRTSEIFGVRELVIPSKKILKDPDFLNVTVTAEKWLPFVECAPKDLDKLLLMYRETGYSVEC